MRKLLFMAALALGSLTASAQHVEWTAAQLPQTQADIEAAGYHALWGGVKYYGTPGAYTLFDDATAGVKAVCENVSYVSVGNNKYSGYETYPFKLIMGMSNSTRDGVDASAIDTLTALADLGLLRKTGDGDDGTVIYDALITLDVASTAEYGQVAMQYNRGGNNSAMYVVDATKSFMVLQSVTRCPDDAVKTHTAMFNVQPGHKYYVFTSEKGSVELYKLAYTAVSADGYDTKDGGTSGIQNVTTPAVKVQNAAMYNLAGQRVDKNFKGIVIQNGKKFINK